MSNRTKSSKSKSTKSAKENYDSSALKVLLILRGDQVIKFFEASPADHPSNDLSAKLLNSLWDQDTVSEKDLATMESKFISFAKAQDNQMMTRVSERIKILSFKGGQQNDLKSAYLEVLEEKYLNSKSKIMSLNEELLKSYQDIYNSWMADVNERNSNPIELSVPSGNMIIKIVRIPSKDSGQAI